MTSKHSLLPAQRSDAAVSRFLSNRDHRACFPSPRSSKIGPFFHQSSPLPDGFWARYNIEQSVIVAPELGTPNQKLLLSALMEAVRPREKGLQPFQKAGQAVKSLLGVKPPGLQLWCGEGMVPFPALPDCASPPQASRSPVQMWWELAGCCDSQLGTVTWSLSSSSALMLRPSLMPNPCPPSPSFSLSHTHTACLSCEDTTLT